jgi:septal ring factor EnvC (AmiA/AmiB activator)
MRRAPVFRFILPCLLAAALSGPALAASKAAEKSRELKVLKGQIDKLKREIESAEGNKADVLDELKQSEQSISQINRNIYELAQELQEANAELGASRREADALRERIETQRAQLARLLVQQYENGAEDGLRLLLNKQDPNALARDIEYYGYIARARSKLIGDLKLNLAEAEVVERETREKSEELARIQGKQKSERQALQKEAANRRGTLVRLDKQIAARRQQVQRLQQDEKRLTRLIERLARAMAAKPKPGRPQNAGAAADSGEFARLKGHLKLPVNGDISNRFGAPRAETGIPWKGVFIRAADGSQVKALAGGRVVFADWLRGFGNLLIIDHDDGYMSLYGYNESLYKQVGETVRAGDVVSAAGNSGGNAESGLYFEVRFQGKPVDPLQWVGKR